MPAFPVLALLAALAALILPATALADAGDIDAAYHENGLVHPKVAADAGGQSAFTNGGVGDARDIAIAGDGGLVLLDAAAGELIKRNPAGDAAASFGTDGIAPVLTSIPAGETYEWNRVVPYGMDQVVVGTRTAAGGERAMAVAKVFADGTQDTSFGTGGVAVVQPSSAPSPDSEGLVAIVHSGQIIVGGLATDAGGKAHFALARLDAGGAPDLTVGDADGNVPDGPGFVVTPISDGTSAINALGTVGQTIVAAGSATQADGDSVWAVAQYDEADLLIDSTFGAAGKVVPVPTTASGSAIHELRVGGSGEMIAGGLAQLPGQDAPTFTVARLTADGDLDTADLDAGVAGEQVFGDDGVVSLEVPGEAAAQPARFGGMVVGDDSTVVAGSYRATPTTDEWVWIRWDALGAVDQYWGQDGNGVAGGTGSSPDKRLDGLTADSSGNLFAAATDAPADPAWAPAPTPALVKIDEAIAAPANEPGGRPSIGATAAVDANTLTPAPGTWTGRYIDFTYSWKRCDDPGTTGCVAVGAQDTPLALTASMVGKWVAPVYTGTNPAGTGTAEGQYERVMARPPAFTAAPAIAETSTVPVGTTLHVGSNGDFGPATDPQLVYQWEECEKVTPAWVDIPNDLTAENNPQCATINGAESDTYVVKEGDRNLRVQVFVSNTHLGSGLGASNDASWSATVAVGGAATGTAPANTAPPAIEPGGAVIEGDTLKAASNGTWTGTAPIAFARQWERCGGTAAAPTACNGIAGATGDDYRTSSADTGKVVRLRVTAQNSAGAAAADSTARAVNAKPAQPQPAATPRPVPPALPAKKPTYMSTLETTPMPDVRGKVVDKAIESIERAGIYADVIVDTQARSKPLTLNGRKLLPGQVHTQSTSAGTNVTSSITSKHRLKLVVEAGRPGIKACQDSGFRKELKGIDLSEAWALLEEKRCDGKVDLDFKVAGTDEPEVRSASKDGKGLKVTVTLPKSQAEMDLFPTKSQGAFPADPMPSFGADDWALTADVQNIFGIRVYDRYIGDGSKVSGARVGVGAEVYLDADGVGEEDDVRRTRPDTGDAAIFSKFRPTKGGTVYYLVQMQDAAGQKVFGYGFFKVKRRSGRFSTVAGETYDVSGGRASRVARAAGGPVAHAASVDQLFRWVQGIFQSSPVQHLAAAAKSAGEGLVSMAKRSVGAVQFTLGSIASNASQLIQVRAATVVASGGANVVAAGGANVVSAGGANVVAAGGANVVAAGGMNLLGQAKLVNGTGSLRVIPTDSRLLSDNGLGLISDNGLGLQNVSKVIAPSEGAPVVAAGGMNLIGTAAGNVVAAGGMNLIGPAGGN